MAKKTTQPTCQIAKRAFRIKGKETFLYSGEVHYFRIPRRYWKRHMQALIDAGCSALSSYVPWSWHEYNEGTFDLTGKTHPERDLAGFVDLAKEMNLYVTLKPGPYIMAETTDQGIPRWLTRDYPETCARDVNGTGWGPDFVAYASPVFREKAARWLRQFGRRIVVPRQSAKRGAVIMMQLCNEIGMFQWLGARGDYSPANTAAWHKYLAMRFRKVDQLTHLLDREVREFTDLAPPNNFCYSRRDYVLYRLWHDYHRWLYGDYVRFIADTLRGEGVSVPFFTNVGGWVFGRAHEFPLNGTFHRETAKMNPDLLYGIDHIPEFVSTLNSHDGIVATQIADELQGGKGPLYSAELQCGSREHGVEPYPEELALFYRHCLIHGLTGMNFYMFAQGRNPKGRGVDGPMFYWYNAVNYKGERQDVYPVVQELGQWLKHNGDQLISARKPAGMAVAYYPHLYETEFLFPKLQKKSHADPARLGIMEPVSFRDQAYFDGVIRILVKKSIPYDLADLTTRSVENLLKYPSLVLLSTDIMDTETQKKIVQYVKKGGHLVIFPTLPKYDLDFTPCTILKDTLGLQAVRPAASNRVYMGRLRDIPVHGSPHVVKGSGARTIAQNAKRETMGVEKKIGKGYVRFFGFQLHYTIEEHPELWSAMMKLDKVACNAKTDNDALQVEARYVRNEGILFVGNLHRTSKRSHVTVRHPAGQKSIDLGVIELPGLTGLLLPINKSLGNGLSMLYAHGELLGSKAGARGAVIELRGPQHSRGRIALSSRKKIDRITVDGHSVPTTIEHGVTYVEYEQTGNVQLIEVAY